MTMGLPGVDQYQFALQNPRTAFQDRDLKTAKVETNPIGLPKVISGGFALTYHLSNGQQWAVRCFHKKASELQTRYAAISRTLTSCASPYFITVDYLPQGVLVSGNWYPVTKMPWVDGIPINRYIESNTTQTAIARLLLSFKELVKELQRLRIAHGDLQHGNILVDGKANLTLVDYDGMFVPELWGMKANESGHPNFQHPLRKSQFDAELDRFSALAITVALEALAAKPALWKLYSNGDNLLFKQTDLHDPDSSPLFGELKVLPGTKTYAERLASVCLGEYAEIPTLDDFLAGSFKVTPRKVVVPTPIRPQFAVLGARDVRKLVQQEGDIVTVVGQITAIHQALTRYGQPYAFLNFGDWRTGCFYLVLWKEALDLFGKLGANVGDYCNKWVSVTGLIEVYRPWRGGGQERPQVVVNMPSEIQVITDKQAKGILEGQIAAPPTATARPLGGRPTVKKETADALNQLYSKFPSVPARTPAGARQTRGTRRPAPKQKHYPRPTYGRRPSSQRKASDWCFVATAVYENPESMEVRALRRFRDRVLARSGLGRAAVRLYWLIGPKAALVVVKLPMLRPPLRWVLRKIAQRC